MLLCFYLNKALKKTIIIYIKCHKYQYITVQLETMPPTHFSVSTSCLRNRRSLYDGERKSASEMSTTSCSGDWTVPDCSANLQRKALGWVKDNSLLWVRIMAVWRRTRSASSVGKGSNCKNTIYDTKQISINFYQSVTDSNFFQQYAILYLCKLRSFCVREMRQKTKEKVGLTGKRNQATSQKSTNGQSMTTSWPINR